MSYTENNFEYLHIPENWAKRWPNFQPSEVDCNDGTPFPLTAASVEALDNLQALRSHLNFAFKITSAYRSPAHNKKVGGANDSQHLTGTAFDLAIYGLAAFRLIQAAPRFGFLGIGVMQKGPLTDRYVHIDTRRDAWIWSY